jgi:hypothetical protein
MGAAGFDFAVERISCNYGASDLPMSDPLWVMKTSPGWGFPTGAFSYTRSLSILAVLDRPMSEIHYHFVVWALAILGAVLLLASNFMRAGWHHVFLLAGIFMLVAAGVMVAVSASMRYYGHVRQVDTPRNAAELPGILATRTDVLSPRMVHVIEGLADDWRRLDERVEGLSAARAMGLQIQILQRGHQHRDQCGLRNFCARAARRRMLAHNPPPPSLP